METLVTIREKNSNELLFQCPLKNIEEAYIEARKLEEMGIDFIFNAPHIHDTLADSLGVSSEHRAEMKESIAEEISGHDASCCFKPGDTQEQHH